MPRSIQSKALIGFSSLMLAHACYSAHEHSSLPAHHITPSSDATSIPGTTITSTPAATGSSLPLDITLETLISLALLLVGIVSSGWEFKPISLRKYTGGLENGSITLDGVDGGSSGGKKAGRGRGLYDALENRVGFLDVRKQRKEFSEWMKTEGS